MKNKKSFFGLSSSEKVKIVRKAVDKATEEQLNTVSRHGGITLLKNYSHYCN